ncbi:hypothetical protein [Cellvibrio sp. UBA7661]|uniref:hypothetical protein n=1 Tax=Cellvibrio sp. UBA7661 TaxID=1946311 RepID=UPI002F358DD6
MEQAKNLSKFKEEVLSNGVNAVLPENLSDSWLEYLVDQAEQFIAKDKNAKPSAVVAAIMTILLFRNNYTELSIELSELSKYIHLYALELSIEAINRSSDRNIGRPTLENILTNREIHNYSDIA